MSIPLGRVSFHTQQRGCYCRPPGAKEGGHQESPKPGPKRGTFPENLGAQPSPLLVTHFPIPLRPPHHWNSPHPMMSSRGC